MIFMEKTLHRAVKVFDLPQFCCFFMPDSLDITLIGKGSIEHYSDGHIACNTLLSHQGILPQV